MFLSKNRQQFASFLRSHGEAEIFETQFNCFPLVLFDESKFEEKWEMSLLYRLA